MKALIPAVLLLCSGCFDYFGLDKNLPDPFEAIESTSGCLGPWQGPRGVKLNSVAIAYNEKLLKNLFEHKWKYEIMLPDGGFGPVAEHERLVNSDKAFCEHFGGIPITYVDTADFTCSASATGYCLGVNDSHGITLESQGKSLAHELIHSYELEHLIFNTGQHPAWEEKGYNSLENTYQAYHDPTVLPRP